MQRVFQTDNLVDAQIIHDELQAHGLDATINGSYLIGGIGELAANNPLSVWVVEDRDYDLAREVIQKIEHNRNNNGQTWGCKKCSEQLTESYELCWNCGSTRNTEKTKLF